MSENETITEEEIEEARLKKEAEDKAEDEAAARLKEENARLKAKEEEEARLKTSKQLPELLFMVLTGRTYSHNGRSQYLRKKGGIQFDQGNIVVINHPVDIAFFMQKSKEWTFMVAYPTSHPLSIDKSSPAISKTYAKKCGIPLKHIKRHLVDKRVPIKLIIDKKGKPSKFWIEAVKDAIRYLARSN
ncbi:MAG: hypothetical protein V3V19_11325 [Cocleimonas sp.]